MRREIWRWFHGGILHESRGGDSGRLAGSSWRAGGVSVGTIRRARRGRGG